MNDCVIAERSAWVTGGCIMLWVGTGIFLFMNFNLLPAIINKTNNENYSSLYMLIFTGVLFLIGAIIYSYWAITIPMILAEISRGILYLYPNKKTRIAVDPAKIHYIALKNYSGRGITYSSGKLTVETDSENIILHFVKDADNARRQLEELRINCTKINQDKQL